ncbi:MAG TPA: UxaA family hydrolase, partial [Longimicrobiales bacterium]
MSLLIRIHPDDNVAVATQAVAAGTAARVGNESIDVVVDVPAGHKIALADLPADAEIVKYGFPIGRLTQPVRRGEWVHSHNLGTQLADSVTYRYGG